MQKQKKQLPKPRAIMKNLDDFRRDIPEGGLLDPKLREGEKFDVAKLKKQLFGR